MRTLLSILLLIGLFCTACNPSGKAKQDEPLVFTMPEDSIEKATAVIWVDKNAKKNHDRQKTRAVKAKVDIAEDGKITVIEFVKNYPIEVQNYVKHHLIDFRITPEMMEKYLKPGEQFLQMRYSPYILKDNEKKYRKMKF